MPTVVVFIYYIKHFLPLHKLHVHGCYSSILSRILRLLTHHATISFSPLSLRIKPHAGYIAVKATYLEPK